MTGFVTLAEPAEHREVVKGSVFIAYAAHTGTIEDAFSFLRDIAARHADASHLCWAYRIGANYRFSDAGEPGGTAGQPIYRAIEGQSLDRVTIGVVRYFGGTKLGAGGLVRAYGGVAAEALRTAVKRQETPRVEVEIRVPFAQVGAAYHVLDQLGATDRRERYDEQGLHLIVRIAQHDLAHLEAQLRDATRDAFRLSTPQAVHPGS